jgi:hypothetical protein
MPSESLPWLANMLQVFPGCHREDAFSVPTLTRGCLIDECDRLATDLDQEVRNEENRVRIHDPAHSAYSIYAKATASRRDNLRRSADELRAHLAKAEKALIEFMAIRRLTGDEGAARNGVAGKNVGQSE